MQVSLRTTASLLIAVVWEYVLFLAFTPALQHHPKVKFSKMGPLPAVGRFDNLFGHEQPFPFLFGMVLLVAMYVARQGIRRWFPDPKIAWRAYLMLVAAALPFLWLFVANQWHDPYSIAAFCWIGTPVTYLTIQAVRFHGEMRWGWQASVLDFFFETWVLWLPWYFLCWLTMSLFFWVALL